MSVRLMRVDAVLLADLLHLPKDTEIVAVTTDTFCAGTQVVFRITSPEFSDIETGRPIPEVNPEFTRKGDVVSFVGWNDRKGK